MKKIITVKDLKIAKIAKKVKKSPCGNEFAAYLDNLKSGHDYDVPAGITRAFADCVDDYYKTPKQRQPSVNYQLSLHKKRK